MATSECQPGKRAWSRCAWLASVISAGLLGAPAGAAPGPIDVSLLDRLTWGVDSASLKELAASGASRFVEDQLRAPPASLPPPAQAQVDAMRISREPMAQIVVEMDAQNKAANATIHGLIKYRFIKFTNFIFILIIFTDNFPLPILSHYLTECCSH